jgi:hypothetical protein
MPNVQWRWDGGCAHLAAIANRKATPSTENLSVKTGKREIDDRGQGRRLANPRGKTRIQRRIDQINGAA